MTPYSVLMSVYEKEIPSHFQEALESMFSQTESPNQVVVVCDGPLTNGLNKVLEDYEKKYPTVLTVVEKAKNTGLADSLNIGLSKTRNEFVARMDSDDIARKDRCEKQIKCLEEGFDLVGSCVSEFSTNPDAITGYRDVPETLDGIIQFSKKEIHSTIRL